MVKKVIYGSGQLLIDINEKLNIENNLVEPNALITKYIYFF